jgi:hypothetical protein
MPPDTRKDLVTEDYFKKLISFSSTFDLFHFYLFLFHLLWICFISKSYFFISIIFRFLFLSFFIFYVLLFLFLSFFIKIIFYFYIFCLISLLLLIFFLHISCVLPITFFAVSVYHYFLEGNIKDRQHEQYLQNFENPVSEYQT